MNAMVPPPTGAAARTQQAPVVSNPASGGMSAPSGARLVDWFRQWRNGVVAKPSFQKHVLRIPGLSWMAKQKANRLFAITAGFAHAQTLYACEALQLFARLNDNPGTTQELSEFTALPEDRLSILLDAASMLGLITQHRDGRWWLDDLGVVVTHDAGLRAMIRHHAMVYRDLADPVALLRAPEQMTETSAFWHYTVDRDAIDDDQAHSYSELMRISQGVVAEQVLDTVSFQGVKRLMDVGGGHGAFLEAVGRRNPELDLWLLDLPPVAKQGAARLKTLGLANHIEAYGRSFFDDDLPKGADMVSLVRVLYDHGDEAALAILKNVHACMGPDATLLVAEPMAGRGDAQKLLGAYFNFYLLAMRSGRCRSTEQIVALLGRAGFTRIQVKETRQPLYATAIVAKTA